MASPDLFARCRGLGVDDNLALYAELLGDDEVRHEASLPALALRDKARAGEVDRQYIPLLVVALVDAPNLAAFTHLAKALATFGRAAHMAAPYLIERLEGVAVTNDRRFWVLDAGLWSLGYVGGEGTKAWIERLAGERPSRVLRSKSVYQGEIREEQREEMHRRTLEGVLALLDREDPGGWLDKKTSLKAAATGAKPTRMAPWMTR
jgi:hypothetical protein